MSLMKTIFHVLGIIQFGYGCYFDYTYVRIPSTPTSVTPFGGKFKYLTYLDAMVQTIYFSVALLNDIFGSNDSTPSRKPVIRKIKDLMFTSLAFPLSFFVGITFWGIYAVDRELILPRMMDAYFPQWLNQLMHTNVMLFSITELVTSFRMYPNRKVGFSILGAFMLSYVVWVHYIYFLTGSWVYPILTVMNWPLRVMFYLFSLSLVFCLYCFGESLNKIMWSKEVKSTVKSGKKKAK